MKSAGSPGTTVRFYSIRFPLVWHALVLIVSRLVALNNRTKTFLHFGLVVIAICTALDSFLLVSLGYRYARSLWYPADPANLETPSTYINFDLLYRNGTKTNFQFPPIQALPRALAQVSAAEPDKVYPQWPLSYLAAYGAVPYNDRRLQVQPEVGDHPTQPSAIESC